MGAERASANSHRSVLIVEDEPDNREILRTVVEEVLGLSAVLTTDGGSAVRLASDVRPVLILMDLMIPVLDGFEAIARLKSEGPTAGIPVVAISALGRPSDRQRALDAGADSYVSKPFDLDVLASTIRELTTGKTGSSRQ